MKAQHSDFQQLVGYRADRESEHVSDVLRSVAGPPGRATVAGTYWG
jgi:hypothetical protein